MERPVHHWYTSRTFVATKIKYLRRFLDARQETAFGFRRFLDARQETAFGFRLVHF